MNSKQCRQMISNPEKPTFWSLVSTPPYSQWLNFAVVENFVHYIMKEPTVAEHCFFKSCGLFS